MVDSSKGSPDLGRFGVWCVINALTGEEAVAFAQKVEAWGYSALWTGEAEGRDPFALIAHLGAHTESLVFATGIANIYVRDPLNMNANHKTLSEFLPNRFVLGLGVSHKEQVTDIRGHHYQKPVTAMRAYLEAMRNSRYVAPQPRHEAPILLAALRKNMLRLAAGQTQGAHPYLVPPEHTKKAREILGKGPWLCPEQMVLLETDAENARQVARKTLAFYLKLPNYLNNLRELGFIDQDFENGGSDKLFDAIVAWGDVEAIRERIQAHYDAGADHVCIQALRPDGERGPDMELLEKLAPVNN
jgi:probable F420-dependent oxidoreductase